MRHLLDDEPGTEAAGQRRAARSAAFPRFRVVHGARIFYATSTLSEEDVDVSIDDAGRRVVTIVGGGPSDEVWVADADGTGRRKLGNSRWARWSPDGSKIAYSHETAGERHALHVAGADGTGSAMIADVGHHHTSFAWSPDGLRLAYTSNGIWTADADGSNRRKISDGIAYTFDCDDGTAKASRAWGPPVWSPDGRQIAFSTTTLGGSSATRREVLLGVLAVMGSDGSGLRPLATHYQRTDIEWSPDSAAIAFLSVPRTSFAGQNSVVRGTPLSAGSHIAGADGSAPAKVADQPENPSGSYHRVSERSWSPDGTRILITPLRPPADNESATIASADGTPLPGIPPNGYYNAAWSPDGTRILAVNSRPRPGSIWVLDAGAG